MYKKCIGIPIIILLSANVNAMVIDLGTLPGGNWSIANDINNKGYAIGQSDNRSGIPHATLWNLNTGEIKDLGTLPGYNKLSIANSINDEGDIVGYSEGVNYRASLWNISMGTVTELKTLPKGRMSFANGINNKGYIVGQSDNVTDYNTVFWDMNTGTVKILQKLPNSGGGEAKNINDNGRASGLLFDSNGSNHAIIWDMNTGKIIKDLGFGTVNGQNNLNQVVGEQGNKATYWEPNEWARTTLGVYNSQAKDINDFGEVVGTELILQWNATYWNTMIGTKLDLGTLPGGGASEGNSINELRQIVGTTYYLNGGRRATFWSFRIKGDVDDSGIITSSDALLMLRKAVGQNIAPYHIFALTDDVTCDKKITSSDALLVLRKAVGQNANLNC